MAEQSATRPEPSTCWGIYFRVKAPRQHWHIRSSTSPSYLAFSMPLHSSESFFVLRYVKQSF